MRLLLFNLVTDADDPVLGFASGWVRALAGHCRSIDVITMRAGRVDLPTNAGVHSVGKEKGYSVPRRVAEFYRLLFRVLRTQPIEACFSHMMPVFSALGGPVLRARGIPLVTWYAHPSLTPVLRLAHHLSNRMVTSLPGAYPYRRDKLTVVGQGIDTDMFSPGGREDTDPPLLLCVGRLSAAKDHPTLIEAAARLKQAGGRFRLALVGGPAGPGDQAHADALRTGIANRGLTQSVQLVGPLPPPAVVPWYRRCTAHVNLTPAGFGDKVALEAMSCGRPSLVANEGFLETLGPHAERLVFPRGDAAALAGRIRALLAMTSAERARLGLELRARVVERHSLEGLALRLVGVLAELAARRSPG